MEAPEAPLVAKPIDQLLTSDDLADYLEVKLNLAEPVRTAVEENDVTKDTLPGMTIARWNEFGVTDEIQVASLLSFGAQLKAINPSPPPAFMFDFDAKEQTPETKWPSVEVNPMIPPALQIDWHTIAHTGQPVVTTHGSPPAYNYDAPPAYQPGLNF